MKALFRSLTSILSVLLLVLFFSSCGKKETSTDTKSTDTKKEDVKSDQSSSSDVDGMINEYEKIMKEYVDIVQKVKKGETTQTTRMQELSTKTQEWAKKLAEIAPKLTPQQSQRIADISKMGAEQMAK